MSAELPQPFALILLPLRLATRAVQPLARVAGLGPDPAAEERRPLRWSAPLPEVVKRLVAGQEVAVWVEAPRRFRGHHRFHLLLQPLREVVVLGAGEEPVPGGTREDWMVWQSLTSTARPARLPTDATRLARRLGLPPNTEGRLLERALRELMAALYESRAT